MHCKNLLKKVITSLLLAVSCSGWVYAQNYQTISGRYESVSFDEFVEAVEGQTKYHFYYKTEVTDSIRISFEGNKIPIDSALNQALQATPLLYTIAGTSVFITHNRKVLAQLPIGFFDGSQADGAQTAFDYSDFDGKEKVKKIAEEKLYIIGRKTNDLMGSATITGVIRDSKSGESVIGGSLYIKASSMGTSTNQFGYFSLTIPKGQHEITVQSIGMKTTTRQVMLYGDGKIDIEMEEDITPLKEVLVESERGAMVTSMEMGVEKLDIKTMKQLPLVMGETDIMKVMLTLPGVQTVGEGTTGINVRGGATNQNLILFNDATVYNPSHLFGFFSTFNPDVLKSVELYKSGINAEYGGRLSSVLDVSTREGNSKKISGSGGISPITARLSLEGPIIKDKTTFLLGFRSTYSDWILRRLDAKELQNSTGSFYDLNASVNHIIDDNNNLFFSAYVSKDKFTLNSDTLYSYGDWNGSVKWKHVFNKKLYGVFTGAVNQYRYSVESDINPVNAASLDFSIQQWNAKADMSYFLNAQHTITAGASIVRYGIEPGNYNPIGNQSEVTPNLIQHEQGIESAIYIGENYEVNSKLSVYGGLRYSFYTSLGPRDVYVYGAGAARSESTIQDTIRYSAGKSIANYGGLEPRLSLRYSISNNSSVKFSYNRMRQYIQMLSNTTAIAPTDIWKLSDSYVGPQIGDQFSVGYYKNLKGTTIEMSVEAYYKIMSNTLDFKDGAILLNNNHLETEVLDSEGKAYGVEFLLKKSLGKLNGWISYTYSRSFLRTQGEYSTETINDGDYYPSSYDKPHAFNFIGNYKVSRRFNFSLNVTYSTGRPITLPIAKYELGGTQRVYYSDRNAYRIPDYFRTDFSINIEGNHKIKKLAHSSWTFSVYNLTGRANAYSVYFTSENGVIKGYKLSIFARPIPTITYNFKF